MKFIIGFAGKMRGGWTKKLRKEEQSTSCWVSHVQLPCQRMRSPDFYQARSLFGHGDLLMPSVDNKAETFIFEIAKNSIAFTLIYELK
jgi:hypothetical protein